MARGYFSGLAWGTAAAGFGLVVLSLAAPLPRAPEAVSEAPADVDSTAADAPVPEEATGLEEGAGRDADLVELPPTAPEATESDPDTLGAMDTADTEPAALPEVGGSGETLAGPAEPTEEAAAPAADDQPAAPAAPQAPAPADPGAEVALSISTEPAQPVVPEVAEDPALAAIPQEDAAPEVVTTPDPALPVQGAEDIQPPQAPADGDAAGVDDTPATDPASAPQPEEAPEDAPRLAVLPQIGTTPDPDTTDPVDPDVTPGTASDSAPVTTVDRVPGTTFDSVPGTIPGTGSRLPVIGAEDPAPQSPTAPELPDQPQLPPIQAFAAPFDNPDDKPLMSIILIDGPESVGREALADFPYPLTFAIDPTQPDAAARMHAYRAAGFEVVALVDLPAAALPTDAEVSLAAGLNTLNHAVAILEGTGTGIQGNRPLSDQVTEIVGQTGHGLITQDNGLNTVPKLAEREGVPTAIVFRDFDGAGQTPTVMRRFLDQAAFRAGQQGAVVMLGRVQPDTVSALLLWGLQDRASRVALAPITAVLSKVH